MQLTLETGETFEGTPFGAMRESHGEVVFNTGMTGYVEALTDPSYRGQILVLTYPLQGNYGVPKGPFESKKIQVQGLVVGHYSNTPSHHTSDRSLGKWLENEGVPAIYGVDTRALTIRLRVKGSIPGGLHLPDKANAQGVDRIDIRRVLDLVVEKEIVHYRGNSDLNVLLLDTGAKENIVRSLCKRGVSVVRAPWNSDWHGLLDEVDGVFMTNGPGDPVDAGGLIDKVRTHVLGANKPVFGICFGHQLLSLAAGARTYKMKFGHRGVNQPVRDLSTGRCYITSQNHGYVVQTESLPNDFVPWFENLNDGSNEGIRHQSRPISSVQFHPEASPGPSDTSFLFDEFKKTIMAGRRTKRDTPKLAALTHRELA